MDTVRYLIKAYVPLVDSLGDLYVQVVMSLQYYFDDNGTIYGAEVYDQIETICEQAWLAWPI